MQAKDIPDAVFVEAVRADTEGRLGGAIWWDLAEKHGWPEKVALAKARKLIRRGVLEGCDCGCRGDFRVLEDA